jgi:fructosamine-3-kinase
MSFYRQIETVLSERTGQRFKIENRQAIDGGCINVAECLSDANRSYFIKTEVDPVCETGGRWILVGLL